MAFVSPSSTPLLLFLFSLIFLTPILANARPAPCSTLLISFTISSSKSPLQFSYSSDPQNPSEFFTIVGDVDDSNPKPFLPSPNYFLERPQFPQFIPFDEISSGPRKIEIPRSNPFGSLGYASSLRDRTKDILSVVVAMLFGVSCGALTGATMYLAWSVIMSRYDAGEYDSEDEVDDVSPKAMGYVKMEAAAVPAKEGYEGN